MPEFTSEQQPDNKTRRGKSFKTKLLDAIREEALFDTPVGSSRETAEKIFIRHVAERAQDPEDNNSAMLLKELLGKAYPSLKAALPECHFDIKEDSTPAEKANAAFLAAASGQIPPDVGAILIQAARNTIDIEINTEIKERLEAIEESLNINV